MKKATFKILQNGIGVGIVVLFLCWALRPAEAALLSDNIEALTDDEIRAEDVCTKAGGYCVISINNWAKGISLEDQK